MERAESYFGISGKDGSATADSNMLRKIRG